MVKVEAKIRRRLALELIDMCGFRDVFRVVMRGLEVEHLIFESRTDSAAVVIGDGDPFNLAPVSVLLGDFIEEVEIRDFGFKDPLTSGWIAIFVTLIWTIAVPYDLFEVIGQFQVNADTGQR